MPGVENNSRMNAYQYDEIAREVFAPAYISIAQRIKEKTGITRGICLDAGAGGGLGSAEIRKQIQVKMKERNPVWHDRSKKNADHRKEYEEALKSAGITNCSVIRGEEGSWIEIYKLDQ